ncbi:MAG TPA: DUF4433 domain-containing protein [Smithellaceae bacterium]|mgnify:CR=1 FL=1|nr:MAG: hypothetical protein BWX92_02967 [Deltaproteobacteria bacterium ADurb.Bin135]HPL66622.1 DUF4433 domain-containing protein [Smithellaceae bacterium]
MPIPSPTPIYRIIHIDNLDIYLHRRGLYAPNFEPTDGLDYRTIHNTDIQRQRQALCLNCGPCGVVHDYVPFYFGYLSPMLLQLKTDRVEGYYGGQEPIIYLVSTVQAIQRSGNGFVFSDGHGIAAFTEWYDDLANLNRVDWDMVYQRYWTDNVNDMDRQRRKQAEFLIHRFCDWNLICEIGVINATIKKRVEEVMNAYPSTLRKPIRVQNGWYYY